MARNLNISIYILTIEQSVKTCGKKRNENDIKCSERIEGSFSCSNRVSRDWLRVGEGGGGGGAWVDCPICKYGGGETKVDSTIYE